MAFDDLTADQQNFISKFLRKGFLSSITNRIEVGSYEDYLEDEAKYDVALRDMPPSDPVVMDAIAKMKQAHDLRNKGEFSKARKLIPPLVDALVKQRKVLVDLRKELIGKAAQPSIGTGGTTAQVKSFDKARDAVTAALPDALPSPAQIKAARKALDYLVALADQLRKTVALAKTNPKAAKAAGDALEAFALATGGEAPTPETLQAAETRVTTSQENLGKAEEFLKRAASLPQGSEEEKANRDKKMKAAQEVVDKARAALTQARDHQKGLKGAQLLTEALTVGPLSANTGKPFADDVAENFVKGFQADPELASKAVGLARGSRNPGAVAAALTKVAGKVADGFADKNGKTLPEGTDPRAYAETLLTVGAHCGEDYFDRMEDYIASGAHLQPSGLGDDPSDKPAARGQKRSVAVASALLGKDGALDLDGDKAKAAIGNLLFHPDAVKNAQPAMNATVLKTLTELRKPKATEILKGMTAPTPGGGAEGLVALALGKSGPVTADDSRTAVLATMMKSLDQGPVGSCFSTAPCRRLRESDPLLAMEKFSEIASKGTLTTAKPPPEPVVANIPPGEDPIMRTLEYTLATTMARNKDSSERAENKKLTGRAVQGIEGPIRTALGKSGSDDIAVELAKVAKTVRSAFDFVYDATAKLDGVSDDGSSSEGRFVMVDKASKKKINSRADYIEAVKGRVFDALGLDPASEEAKALLPHIETTFVDKTVKTKTGSAEVEEAPWKLSSGGDTTAATGTLFGEVEAKSAIGKSATKSDTRAKQGARTLSVMKGLMGQLSGPQPDMVTMRTVGQHGFNAMPNNPAFQDLLKGPGTLDEKLDEKLTKPGQKIATTALDPARAVKAYEAGAVPGRKALEGMVKSATNATERKRFEDLLADYNKDVDDNRPTAPMTPKQIADALTTARRIFSKPDGATDIVASALMEDVGAPEILIADSNWGSGDDHTYFVVAPDPMTGQPLLWQKTEPPGTMRVMDPSWIDKEWAILKPKTT